MCLEGIPSPRFIPGQKVATEDGYQGIVITILYSPLPGDREVWAYPGWTCWVVFTSPEPAKGIVHESDLSPV